MGITTKVNPKKFALILMAFVIVISLLVACFAFGPLLVISISGLVFHNFPAVIAIGLGVAAAFFWRSKAYWNFFLLILAVIVVRLILIGEWKALWELLVTPQIAMTPVLLFVTSFAVPKLLITSVKWCRTNHGVVRGWGSTLWTWLTTP